MLVLAVISFPCVFAKAADRPNILWITAEDMSPTLGCYGDQYATTPNIDTLARESVRYTHAFATAPVCSPARACLINGLMATTQGTHQMRSVFPIPSAMRGFPALLREAGYYTTNNVKTDYNSAAEQEIIAASWDESSETAHWRNRESGQPFFSVVNLMTSHQSRSMVWPYEQFEDQVQSRLKPNEIHDPAKAPVPPYYPDTPLVRKTVARYYDCVTAMDKQVGEILAQLEDDGLADSTIVLFYSDHGSGMPRHKRALLDSGMHVPLLVRFPKKYASVAPTEAGTTTDRLVNFADFGPTVLSLAGMEKFPSFVEGRAFLGPMESKPRKYVYGHRDRVDEIMDLARSVRDRRYLYIRNYMPHLGYNQQGAWIDQGAIREDFYAMVSSASGEMTEAQRHFAGPTRPREELYDCKADPLNLNNLAESPAHEDVLARMRKTHRDWVLKSRDLGFVPETELWKIARTEVPYDWARGKGNYDLPAILTAAELVGTQSHGRFAHNLESELPSIRYWGAVGYRAAESLPKEHVSLLKRALSDHSEIVRIQAAAALAHHGHVDVALPVLVKLLGDDDTTVILYAARTVELLGERARTARDEMAALFQRFKDEPGDPAWFIRFTTSGYLSRVPEQPNRAESQ